MSESRNSFQNEKTVFTKGDGLSQKRWTYLTSLSHLRGLNITVVVARHKCLEGRALTACPELSAMSLGCLVNFSVHIPE